MKTSHLLVTAIPVAGVLLAAAWFSFSGDDSSPSEAGKRIGNPVESTTPPSSVAPTPVTLARPSLSVAAVSPGSGTPKKNPPPTRSLSLLESTDQESQLEGLQLSLELADSDAKWAHFERARQSSFPRVRAAAVELAVETGGEKLGQFLNAAVVDVDPNVGLIALLAAESQPPEVLRAVQETALHGGAPEVGASAVAQLEIQSDPAAVEILFTGLDSTVGEIRADTQITLELTFDQVFESAAEAQVWWRANQSRYDKDLVLIAE